MSDPPVEPPAPLEEYSTESRTFWQRTARWLNHTDDRYKVGTLTYTRMGLFMIFVWLLWGDLVWNTMENVFPAAMPLQLERLNVPKEWIGYIMGTAGAVINMTFVPVVSFRSDRTRTRWGRRIPYLLFTMPFLCIFLAILGFSDYIGDWIKNSSLPAALGISPIVMIVAVMAVLILLYDIFNVFVNSIFWYLFRDVVPSAFLARFMATFRMVTTISGFIWWRYFFGKIETHTVQIYVGAAVVYFFGFGLMCLMIKEGEYPPPGDYVKGEPWHIKTGKAIRTYVRECFTHPMFVLFYIAQGLFAMGATTVMYRNFFLVRHLKFTLDEMGAFMSVLMPFIFVSQFPLGWLVDKIHPIRGFLIAMTLGTPLTFIGYFYDTYSIAGYTLSAFAMWMALTVIQQPFLQLREASEIPLMMRIFPLAQYGQFSSAQAMLRHFSIIVGSVAGATVMGLADRKWGNAGNAVAYLWHGTFHALGVVCLWIVFIYWRRLGGENFKFNNAESLAVGSGEDLKPAPKGH